MKVLILICALAAISLAEDLEHSVTSEVKKRGVAKSPPSVNSLSSNGHQKPDLTYATYQQPGPVTQTPVYSLPPYNQGDGAALNQQPAFSFLPQQQQLLPLQFVPQAIMMPKYQLVSTKNANGQTHYTLVPQQPVFHNFAQPQFLTLQHPLLANQGQPVNNIAPTTPSHIPQPASNSYVTPQPLSYSTQPNSPIHYQHNQQPALNFAHLGQPSTMLLFAQPSPQLYNNYLTPQSNLLYTPAGQQLLNYYQTNPQAKYQLLYGNSHQSQLNNNYQAPAGGSEYEITKSISGTVQQSLSPQKSEPDNIGLNTNEYISPPDTHFRPIPSYGSRTPPNYKS